MGSVVDEPGDETAPLAGGSAQSVEQTRLDKPERSSKPRLTNAPDFGPRYRVLDVLGRGGMGEVYRAFDTALKEDVALKVVRTDNAELDAYGRFRREIALARKVTNPHVLRVYDLGEHEGLRFLSMEYVDGESLGAVMKREGKLPLDRALGVFRQVCDGLAAAHGEGVIHRDLKPQNVLVDKGGRVRVADFGLARSVGESGLTASGVLIGSPTYMSPEQVKGDDVDERSDIYSLGVMLYQLVTGKAPFQGTTPHSVMEMRLHKKPRPIRELVPDVPERVALIVDRCLEVDPDKRYRTMKELILDLDRNEPVAKDDKAEIYATRIDAHKGPAKPWLRPAIAGAAMIGIVAVGTALMQLRGDRRKPATAPAPELASPAPVVSSSGLIPVLLHPFVNQTGDPVFDATMDVAIEFTLRRSRLLDPYAARRQQALVSEQGDSKTIDEAAAKLQKRTGERVLVARGTIDDDGKGVRVSLQATDIATGKIVFSRELTGATFEEAVPALGKLGHAFRTELGEDTKRDPAEATGLSSKLDAVRNYAVCRQTSHAGNWQEAIGHCKRAIEADPEFANAHAAIATAYGNIQQPSEMRRHFDIALRAIERMSERDRLFFLGQYYALVTRQYDRAIAAYNELLATWPSEVAAQTNISMAYLGAHQIEEGLVRARAAAKSRPTNAVVRGNLVFSELIAGNVDTAIAEGKRALAEVPRHTASLLLAMALAYEVGGQREAADQAYAAFAAKFPSGGVTANADRLLAHGKLSEAAALLEAGIKTDEANKDSDGYELKHVLLAEARLRQGDRKRALAAAAKVKQQSLERFEVALVQLAAGDPKTALANAQELAKSPAPDSRAFAKLIEAEDLRMRGKPAEAVALARDAIAISDVWFGHFVLARSALDAGQHAEAHAELKLCLQRRGEVIYEAYGDVPGLRYAPPVTYYLARTLEAIGSPDAPAQYRAFLAMQPDAEGDPFVNDAMKRARVNK